mmetsp:Transcript_15553/g.32935  ORF Transcript_15553/g.32935 Transcript_15553/m.32935 type:complete len:250 (+) Transcript_15553:270-1019(+)
MKLRRALRRSAGYAWCPHAELLVNAHQQALHAIGVGHHFVQVDTPGTALQAGNSFYKLLGRDLSVPFAQQLKQREPVRHFKPHGLQPQLDRVVLQELGELRPRDHAIIRAVRDLKKAVHHLQMLTLLPCFLYDHQVEARSCGLEGLLHEHACDHRQHRKAHDASVYYKKHAVPFGDILREHTCRWHEVAKRDLKHGEDAPGCGPVVHSHGISCIQGVLLANEKVFDEVVQTQRTHDHDCKEQDHRPEKD